MLDRSALEAHAFGLSKRVYTLTEKFSAAERPLLGGQFREAALTANTEFSIAVNTDDPAEQQDALRATATACVTLRLLNRLALEMNQVTPAESDDLAALIEKVETETARLRRTYRA